MPPEHRKVDEMTPKETLPFEPETWQNPPTEEGEMEQPNQGGESPYTTVMVRPDVDHAVQKLYAEGLQLLAYAEGVIIQADEDIVGVADNLSIIKGVQKALEDARKTYVGPLNDHVKSMNTFFKDYAKPLQAADEIIQSKVKDFRAGQRRQREEQEEINRLRTEAARKEMALNDELSESVGLVEVQEKAPDAYRTPFTTVTTPKTWQFEVEDLASLPDEYKVPDLVKIRRVVVAMKKEGYPIPGVRAWQEEGLGVTPRRY